MSAMRSSDAAPLARLRQCAAEMEEALKEEGFEENGSHGVFVRWQRRTIEDLGALILQAEEVVTKRVEAACERMDKASRQFREDELRRTEILLRGGDQALDMARQAVETAVAGANRAEFEFDRSVARIAKELSMKLLHESQKWLVLKQTSRNRRDAWRLAGVVAAATLALFIGGYEVRAWQDGPATEAVLATQVGMAQCLAAPLWGTNAQGQRSAACWFEQLFPNAPAPKPPRT